MAIAVASVEGASLPSLGSSNLVINKPVGTVAGDWLFCFINISANVTITPPSGWSTDANVSGVKAYRLQAGSSEPSSYTFTRGTTTNTILGTIIRVTGAHATTPVQTSGGITAQSAGTGTSVVIPTLTTTTGFTTLIQIAHVHATTTFTPPGTTTENFDAQYASQSFTSAVGRETVAVGATGTRTWTAGASGQRSGIMYAMQEGATNGSVNAVTATASGAGVSPVVTGGAIVAAVVAVATSLALPPTVSATQSQTVAAVVATASSTAHPPTVDATISADVAAVAATSTAQAVPPTVSGVSNPTVDAATATSTAQAHPPTVAGVANATIVAAAATSSATAHPPTVASAESGTVAALAATATSLALPPVITATQNETVAAVAATANATAHPPLVFIETDPPAQVRAVISSASTQADIGDARGHATISDSNTRAVIT